MLHREGESTIGRVLSKEARETNCPEKMDLKGLGDK